MVANLVEEKHLTAQIITTQNFGMHKAKQRTSFALDEETVELLHSLAGRWRVSQADVVRRAVRLAAAQDRSDADALQRRLADYWERGGVCAEEAASYLDEVAENRAAWERGRTGDSA